ncbi:LOW QUALITY PROTEIN: olfactory receptor 6B1-like [Pterocles gutturalis]
MSATEKQNKTYITEFILLGFGNILHLQVPPFLLFLVIYMVTMMGNILIFVLVLDNQHLHTPMSFFLSNLSCLETCYSSNILPKLLASFVTADRSISYSSCMTQFFIFAFLVGVECYLLAAMSYDQYLSVCKHYGHFFCGFTPVIKCSCSDTFLREVVTSLTSATCAPLPFLFTVVSYVLTITTILRIPSATGREKTFSTCSSHLIVVTVFYSTLILFCMLPKTNLAAFNKLFSVFCTVVTPMVNPLIYALRNKEVRRALGKEVQEFMCLCK